MHYDSDTQVSKGLSNAGYNKIRVTVFFFS